jgi:uncharacterized protein (DUF1330 family)
MAAFFLYDLIEVVDEAKMAEYRAKVFSNVESFGGKYRIVGGAQHVLEGDWNLSFPVVIEFENKQAALNWYESPEYAELKRLRLEAARGNGILIDGDVNPLSN